MFPDTPRDVTMALRLRCVHTTATLAYAIQFEITHAKNDLTPKAIWILVSPTIDMVDSLIKFIVKIPASMF